MKILQNVTKKVTLKPKQKKFLEEFIKNYGHITDTCKAVKIERPTYYRWMTQTLFKSNLDDAMEHFNDSVQRRILNLAMKDDKEMLKFWAKNQMKHRGWVEKSEVKVTGEVTTNLSDEQIESTIKRLLNK